MINTCIDRYRAQLNETLTVELAEAREGTVLAETLINADAEYLLQLVRQLPPAYQTTFNLFAVEGYEYQEIADLLGGAIGSVKSNLSKARWRCVPTGRRWAMSRQPLFSGKFDAK